MVMFLEFLKDTFKYIIIIAILVLIRIFVLTSAQVVGDSMIPTLSNGDFMFVEQISNKLNSLKRFDIVVVKYDRPSYLIKRIVGLPGEKIKFINNELYIDDYKVEENFGRRGYTEDFEIILDDNSYFVMGDNREDSGDSRTIGPIDKKDIKGKLFLRLYPFKKIGLIK